MKKTKLRWRFGWLRHDLIVASHILELAIGIVILASGQNLFAELVGASPDILPPSVPSNVTLVSRTATDIAMSWTPSTDDVGVMGYHVYRGGTLVASPTTTTYDDTGLTPNTSYSYTVDAYDATGNTSAQSSPPLTTATLIDSSAPSIPSNVHQTSSTTSTIDIAWDASTDNVGVTGYDVYRNGALIRTQAATTLHDTGLSVYTSYTYTLSAHDGANNASSLSQPLYGSTAQDITAPTVPDNLHKTSSSVSSITFAWTASTDNIGVTGYRVYRDGVQVGSPGTNSFTDIGLNVSSSYTYTVSAYDNAGNASAQSAPFATDSSDDNTPPTIPTTVHTTSVLDGSISIAWTASTDDVNVTGYKVYRNGSLIGTTATTHFDDSNLTPATNYTYTVKAYDAASNVSAASAALNTQTAYDTTNPSTPSNLIDSAKTDTSISLSWNFATDNIGVTGYDLYRDGTLITTTVGTSYTDTDLDVDTSYTYRVRAHDGSGNNSPQSSQLVTRTLTDLIAPAAPTNIISTAQTTTTMDLSWNAATDDVAVNAYKLYRNNNFVAEINSTIYTDTNLRYNTAYHYTVTALDNAGNESPASTVSTVSTLPDTTAPTVSLTAPTSGQSLQLTFGISATAHDDLDLDRVDFYADSTLIASIHNAPYALNWNSYAVHNGGHSITARAYDASGNTASQAVSITINNPPPPITGDLNGDHKVNLLDLSVLLSHFNKAGSGDFNNNGKVDIFDLSVILSRYGQDNSGYN